MVIGREDPLIGTLPQNNMSGSPALAGQPPAIAGQGSTPMVPTPEMQGGPALAPASPESGSADIGAPLPSDAPEQQAGAGANLDLVKDRGTPSEYWATNIKTLGSAKTMDLMASAANAASGKTGKQATMDPEEVRRAGVQANEVFGVGNTKEQQDTTVEKLIYKPMTLQIQNEVATGITDEDEGVFRIAQTMAQVQGVESDEEAAQLLVNARGRMEETEEAESVIGQEEEAAAEEEVEENEPEDGTAEATAKAAEVDGAEMDRLIAGKAQVDYETERSRQEATKDYDGDGKKDNLWGRFKNWVKKGKDDPTTSVDESKQTVIGKDGKPVLEDVEVTKFMGGMTRQELGMFVFQWGALMMSNADQGFGGAMGAAGQGALAGHQQRGAAEEASALAGEEMSLKQQEQQIRQQQADASTQTAAMSGLAQGFTSPDDGYWKVPVYNAETGETTWETARDSAGKPQKGAPNSADRPFAAQQFQKQLEASGFFSDQEIAMLIAKQPGSGQIRSDGLDAWERRISSGDYPAGMRKSDWVAASDAQREKLRAKFIDSYVGEYMKAFEKGGGTDGALPDNGSPTTDPRDDAVDRNL